MLRGERRRGDALRQLLLLLLHTRQLQLRQLRCMGQDYSRLLLIYRTEGQVMVMLNLLLLLLLLMLLLLMLLLLMLLLMLLMVQFMNVVVIVAVIVVCRSVIIVIGMLMKNQMIVVLALMSVMTLPVITVQVQPRHRHTDTRVRRPHALSPVWVIIGITSYTKVSVRAGPSLRYFQRRIVRVKLPLVLLTLAYLVKGKLFDAFLRAVAAQQHLDQLVHGGLL